MNEHQSGDEFQTLNDQLLTYSFSQHIPMAVVLATQRPRKKAEQKLTFNIVQPLKSIRENQSQAINNKFRNRTMYSNQGREIRIGKATFKSNFQSGNLGQLQQIKDANTYKITMQKEINSNRTSAWFYFRCQGLKGQVNFIISGFTKKTSLYNQGMKVCYRQIRKQQDIQHENNHLGPNSHRNKSQWHRGGTHISYKANNDTQADESNFQLKFTYNFVKNVQTNQYPALQFAYCYPYEYRRVINLVKFLGKQDGVKYESLGKTYEGRDIPMLTIGNPDARKSIVLSARVHPGQTVSSFIMQGFLRELVSDSQFSSSLKGKYLFKIVPMINPDGVVRGNYRFSSAGYDLNRRWKHCYQTSHPQIFYLKNMIKKLHKQKKVLMYVDIHGHSRRKNAFFYGCCTSQYRQKINLTVQPLDTQEQTMSKPKQFPFLMSKLNKNFKYEYCTFDMSKDKQGTARITMCKQLHIDHVYTLQTSFCGSADGGHNYHQGDYINMGKSLLQGISVYFYQNRSAYSARQSTMSGSMENSAQGKTKYDKTQKTYSVFQKFLNIRNQAKQQLKSSPFLLDVGMNGEGSGSDSEPEAGVIPEEQRQAKSTTLNLNVERQEKKSKQKSGQAFTNSKSPNFITSNKSIKITVRQPTLKKNLLKPQQLKSLVDQKLYNLKQQQEQKCKFQKKIIAKTVNNFYSHNSQQLDSLTTNSLMKRNERVHSKQANTRSMLQKANGQRLNSENRSSSNFDFDKDYDQKESQDQRKKLQIMTRNLLKTRQGVQYRRVRKMAQQMKKKANNNTFTLPCFQQKPTIPLVRGIITMNNQLILSKNKVKSIAPSFYPQSKQKNRKLSAQMTYRNNSYRSDKIPFQLANRKLFINGDDISVHCKGTRIYM